MQRLDDLVALAAMAAGSPETRAWVGLVVPNSWNAQNGTFEAYEGTTIAADLPTLSTVAKSSTASGSGSLSGTGSAVGSSPSFTIGPIHLLSPGIGIQAGPRGLERCIIFREDAGYYGLIYDYANDSPVAPAGEIWIQLDQTPQTAPSAQQSFLRLQIDGGVRIGARVKIVGIANLIELGAEGVSQDQNNGVVRQRDLQKAIDDLRTNVQNAINSGYAVCQPGQGVTSPSIARATAQSSTTSYSK